jgi:tRNA 2-thiouridine synthesizing protein A
VSDPGPRVIDARGRRCPLPVIDLARAVPEVAIGSVVLVLADDPAAAVDIPAWCRMRGHDYLGIVATEDGTPAYRVRRAS